MRYYDTLATYERDGFDIIVDKTYEDLNPRDCFDDCHDVDEIIKDIERGHLDWFMLRVRVFVEGLELGSAYLGGMLYEDPKECLTDGSADDIIDEAMRGAKLAVYPLMKKLQAINEQIEREAVTG
jgi:hypothetical protein